MAQEQDIKNLWRSLMKQFKSVADILLALSYVYLILCLVAGVYLLIVFGEDKNTIGLFVAVLVVIQAFIVQQLLKLVCLFVNNFIDKNYR